MVQAPQAPIDSWLARFGRIRPFKDRLEREPSPLPYWPDLDHLWLADMPGGTIQVTGIHEFTRRDQKDDPGHRPFVPDGYLGTTLKAYTDRDGRYRRLIQLIRKTADFWGCDACIVVFNEDASEYAVYNLTQNWGWERMNYREYLDFVRQSADACAPGHLPLKPKGGSLKLP